MNRKSEIPGSDRKDILYDLKSEALFLIIPFMLLIAVKGYTGTWKEILLTPDWSLVCCIIFGQITSKVSRAVASSKLTGRGASLGWYAAKRFVLVVISLACYFGMLSKPTLGLGVFQILLFIYSIFLHFRDGMATRIIIIRSGS